MLCVCLSVRNSESEVWIKSRNSGFSQSCLLTSWSSSPDSALFRLLAALAASMLDVHLRIIHGLFSHPFSLSLLVATNNWSFLSKCLTRSLRFNSFLQGCYTAQTFSIQFYTLCSTLCFYHFELLLSWKMTQRCLFKRREKSFWILAGINSYHRAQASFCQLLSPRQMYDPCYNL